jgi:hypothetical protein
VARSAGVGLVFSIWYIFWHSFSKGAVPFGFPSPFQEPALSEAEREGLGVVIILASPQSPSRGLRRFVYRVFGFAAVSRRGLRLFVSILIFILKFAIIKVIYK